MFLFKKIITQPYSLAVILFLFLLTIVLLVSEYGARSDLISSRLPSPTLGSAHKNFDLKVTRLEDLIKKSGGIDCIFLGSSTVNRGIDPAEVQLAYKRTTGRDIQCFNFGVGALNISSEEILARILIKKYHPKLLVIGRLPGTEEQGLSTEQFIADSAWVQYNLGNFSVNGWLLDHSYVYRYYQRLRAWLHWPEASAMIARQDSAMTDLGFVYDNRLLKNKTPRQIKRLESRLSLHFRDFQVSDRHAAAFENILKLKQQVEIVIVEMPVRPGFLSFFGKGKQRRDDLFAEVRERARQYRIPFLSAGKMDLIPDEGWADYNHMNSSGARVFSQWLGSRIGEEVNKGLISAPR